MIINTRIPRRQPKNMHTKPYLGFWKNGTAEANGTKDLSKSKLLVVRYDDV
jgi:hypothetical protein